jgi:hypothetical protein
MVKGVTRRVIVVKSPDPRLFEQAIFFVREEALENGGVTADQVLEEAERVADGYIRKNSVWGRRLERVPRAVYGLAGALATGLVWAMTVLLPGLL